jgi:hypothetical protein
MARPSDDRYQFIDWENCYRLRHRFTVIGSDKTPMKKHLRCDTCSDRSGKDSYVAYSLKDGVGSFGQWQKTEKHPDEQPQ